MWQIIGHEWAVKLLQQSLAAGRLAHAYLFLGPAQIGKTTLALALAQAINCQGQDPPCGVCRSCLKISQLVHPDVRLLAAESGAIKINQVRDLRREAALSPVEGRFRVYIIPDFHLATEEAANCLLKTLEEPPPSVFLILTATDAAALLPTIVSRCQVFRLRPLPLRQTAEALERLCQVSPERAALLARLSEGRIGWAINACRDARVLQERDALLAALRALPAKGLAERFQEAQKYAQRAELPMWLDLWLSWWRDLLLVKEGCQDLVVNAHLLPELQAEAANYEVDEIGRFIRAIQQAKGALEANANARLTTEILFMDCPRLPMSAQIG